ncbi:actin-domain-containing protein [Syncephalis fuscata]|nr:actin-domain-containing protein [Syncephalis fuscata]
MYTTTTPTTQRTSSSTTPSRTFQTTLGTAGTQLSQLLTPTTSSGTTPMATSGSSGGLPYIGRRHSIYGTEDRVVLDIGSLYMRCGYSGESQPRHLIPVFGDLDCHREHSCNESCRLTSRFAELFTPNIHKIDLVLLEETLRYYLHHVYYRYLLTEPRQRKVLICEPPLMPVIVKEMLARILFDHFQVPSISFAPSGLLALMTAGTITGIVLDSGNWETTVIPVFDARPLIPFVQTTPLAGRALSNRLRILLLSHAQILMPQGEPQPLTADMIAAETLEDIKARLLFVSPFKPIRPDAGPAPSMEGDDFEGWYRDVSAATDATCRFQRADTGQTSRLSIPGWVRERAAEVLFDGDEDEPNIVCCLLESLLKVQPDARVQLAENVLLTGGTAMLPNFQARFHQECIRTAGEHPRYQVLQGLVDKMRFLSGGERGRIFPANCRTWVGGSLVGAIRSAGPEITKDKFNGTVPDWTNTPLASDAPEPTGDGVNTIFAQTNN